jgi:hypothetical protein
LTFECEFMCRFVETKQKHMTLSHQIKVDTDVVDIVVDYNQKEDHVEVIEVSFNDIDYTETLNFLNALNFIYEIDWNEIYKEQKQQFDYDQRENA